MCSLMDTILNDYAAVDLHRALFAAHSDVIKQEDVRVQSKRKANAARNKEVKRTRRSGDANPHTGQSFHVANVNTVAMMLNFNCGDPLANFRNEGVFSKSSHVRRTPMQPRGGLMLH